MQSYFSYHLATLKALLKSASNLSKIWAYFLDNLGQNPNFIALGERTPDPMLHHLLAGMISQLLNQKITTDTFPAEFIQLKRFHFSHGSCYCTGKLFAVLFFSDINKGLLAAPFARNNQNTEYLRFTGTVIPADNIIVFPKHNPSVH